MTTEKIDKGTAAPDAASNGTEAANPFESIALDTLPAATKTRSAADAKLATLLIGAMGDGQAARESTIHPERAAAVKRASSLKRLANGAPELPTGKRAATRIIAVPAGGFQVAVFLADKKAKAAK